MNSVQVAVLISGRGSNLKNLVLKAKDYTVSAIVSDVPEAPGLRYGEEFGIKTYVVNRKFFGSVEQFRESLLTCVKSTGCELVALAGFMRIVHPEFIDSYQGKMINIHPSLLPEFPGLDTHARALSANSKFHGCTVHFVDKGVDTGPIIAQAKCPVQPNDTEDSLAQRVLTLEHELYPWALNALARQEVSMKGTSVKMSPPLIADAIQRGFIVLQGVKH